MTKSRNEELFQQAVVHAMETCGKTQRHIAMEAGFDHANTMSMIKNGIMRVPTKRIVPLADALGVDRAYLLSLWLKAYDPEMLEVIEEQFGFLLSANERKWIAALRVISGGRNPSLTPGVRELLEEHLRG